MDSSNPKLQQDDHLSSICRKNKILIIGFFSVIILLALIIGGPIISLVQKINYESLNPNPAIREFCSPSKFPSSCMTFLASQIKPPYNTNPNHIFRLSVEASLAKLSTIISMVSDGTRPGHAFRSCSSSLGHATVQLNNILEILGIDPDVETYERGNMTAWITAAAEDLAACVSGVESTDGAISEVLEVAEALLGYSKGFLANCETVDEDFRLIFGDVRSSTDVILENLITVSLF